MGSQQSLEGVYSMENKRKSFDASQKIESMQALQKCGRIMKRKRITSNVDLNQMLNDKIDINESLKPQY